ncbi:hypothetical protein E4U13_007239 [Claviceps humidiphila]|uniref:Myb-like domain-containing protein n=1 Tax=Claviceps humidiphila TaxID=1294629 RepID=A0A9P7TRJ3_9HYPO|nr:hypothetical protein E4U13_007239 [Claviceps humidiphila]
MPAFLSAFLLPRDMNCLTPIESQSSSDMGTPSPILHWTGDPIMPFTEASPVFQHSDGQFYPMYPLGMEMPMYDGEGRGYFSESSFCANVDSGSPSREMDYIWSPQMIQSFDHDTTDYTDSQLSEVFIDFSGFPIDGSTNVSLTGEEANLVSTEAQYNSCWDNPVLAAIACQFLPPEQVSSQRPEPMADIYIDPSTSPEFISSSSLSIPSPGIVSSSLGMPSPGIGSSFLGIPSPGIDSLSLSMPGVNQPGIAQPSSAGQSPEVQRNFMHSPSPVPTQPATTNAKEYQDRILMEDRRNGWSYKKIRAVRNFGVTESTLRGRYRNLTKRSHERPRSPTWTEKDVHLLKIAVPYFTSTTGSRKVSWKAVSEFIHSRGDSPHAFAYATCHKKWLEESS